MGAEAFPSSPDADSTEGLSFTDSSFTTTGTLTATRSGASSRSDSERLPRVPSPDRSTWEDGVDKEGALTSEAQEPLPLARPRTADTCLSNVQAACTSLAGMAACTSFAGMAAMPGTLQRQRSGNSDDEAEQEGKVQEGEVQEQLKLQACYVAQSKLPRRSPASAPKPSRAPSMCSSCHRMAVPQKEKTSATFSMKHWVQKLMARPNSPPSLPPKVPRSHSTLDFLDNVLQSRGKPGFHSRYDLGDKLGEGTFGAVRECMIVNTGHVVACKVVQKQRLVRPKDILQARMEYPVHRLVTKHANVLDVLDFYEDDEHMYMVMELCQGGDLFDLLDRVGAFPEPQAAAIFSQILSAVRACHRSRVLHRDLKPENILVSGPNSLKRQRQQGGSFRYTLRHVPSLKLADFGSALLLPENEMASGRSGGSKMYQAPEVHLGKKYDFKADMWSLGVILFSLLCGKFPFTAPTDALLSGMIKRGVFHMVGPTWDAVSAEAKDMVNMLLQTDPVKRASAESVSSHPWMLSHGWRGKQRKVMLVPRSISSG